MDLEFAYQLDWSANELQGSPVSTWVWIPAPRHKPLSNLPRGYWDPESGPHSRSASTLPTKPSPQPLNFDNLEMKQFLRKYKISQCNQSVLQDWVYSKNIHCVPLLAIRLLKDRPQENSVPRSLPLGGEMTGVLGATSQAHWIDLLSLSFIVNLVLLIHIVRTSVQT